MTYTYAICQLSRAAFDEIAAKLREAGYDHAFEENEVIDMRGIGVKAEDERNKRLIEQRDSRQIPALQKLVADLSDALTDEGPDWSFDGLHNLRCRVANMLPADIRPTWLEEYRDPPLVQSIGISRG